MPNYPQPPHGSHRSRSAAPSWWPLVSYVLLVAGALASASALGYWAGRHSRPPPLEFTVPTATPQAPVTAYIAGLVAEPGVYTLAPDARLIDLVVAAGGLLPDADHTALNLAARVNDGQRVIVPTVRPIAVATTGGPPAPTTAPAATTGMPASGAAMAYPLNLNTASVADLDSLPRIGPATAAAIVQWRDANGGFNAVEDLLKVRGIGTATLEALRPYVTAP